MARPTDALAGKVGLCETAHDEFVVGIVDEGIGVLEEFEFFETLLFERGKVLLVRRSDVGEHSQRGADDVAQGRHLAWLTDAGFEDTEPTALVEQPHRERNAHLRVVGAWRARHGGSVVEELVDPLFDDGLAVGAGDAHHGDVEAAAVLFGQQLEGFEGRCGEEEGGFGILCSVVVGEDAYHETAHAAMVETVDVAVAVARSGVKGKEEGSFGIGQRAAVGEQPFDGGVGRSKDLGACERRYLLKSVGHEEKRNI